MEVDLSQYRYSIGSFAARACGQGLRFRRRRRKENIQEAGDRTKVQNEADNEEAAEQERNNSKEKVDHHQKQTEHACAECGGKFNEKHRLVNHVTDIQTERKACPLRQETLKILNRNMSQIHRMQGANHV